MGPPPLIHSDLPDQCLHTFYLPSADLISDDLNLEFRFILEPPRGPQTVYEQLHVPVKIIPEIDVLHILGGDFPHPDPFQRMECVNLQPGQNLIWPNRVLTLLHPLPRFAVIG